MPMEFALYLEESRKYQLLSAESRHLRAAGLSWVRIGQRLKVTDKTAKKAALNFRPTAQNANTAVEADEASA